MDRLFLDANVLFSAAYRSDTDLRQLWNLSDVILCSSAYAIEEARRNLSRSDQRHRLDRLILSVQLFESSASQMPGNIHLPEKDIPIIMAAIAASASHLLTGDVKHFGRYFGKSLEGILILSPGEYLRAKRKNE